jgi:hypothetical protein
MRTIALALVLGLVGAGTASAAPHHKTQARHAHAKKTSHRGVKHAKAKTRHSGAKHASGDGLMKPKWA